VGPFQIELLDPARDRSVFSCGSAPLDRYFHNQVTQDIRRHVTACFVAVTSDNKIAGYYTLASSSVLSDKLPPKLARKLLRYPLVPAIRMGRLAVDKGFRGLGLGGAMLADALIRAMQSEIAAYALVVDAKDKNAAAFYLHHGFLELDQKGLALFLPLASVPDKP
jgi:ribosomal protein S18 acetylase RimI-like enzyme